MIKKSPELIQFEKDFLRKQKSDIKSNLKIFESMYREAVALGILPSKDEMEGLDIDIKIAKVVNSVSKTTM